MLGELEKRTKIYTEIDMKRIIKGELQKKLILTDDLINNKYAWEINDYINEILGEARRELPKSCSHWQPDLLKTNEQFINAVTIKRLCSNCSGYEYCDVPRFKKLWFGEGDEK